MSWFTDFFKGSRPSVEHVIVHFDQKQFAVKFSQEDTYDGSNVRLGVLRARTAKICDTNPEDILLFQLTPRRKLTDDHVSLKELRINNGDHLFAKFKVAHRRKSTSSSSPARPVKSPQVPATPKQQLENAEEAVDKVLGGRIKAFVSDPPKTRKELETEFLVLSETVLQNIIKLDNVDVSGDESLRQRRREIITRFNKYHEQIDQANARARALIDGNEAAAAEGESTVAAEPAKGAAAEASTEGSVKPKRKHRNKKKH